MKKNLLYVFVVLTGLALMSNQSGRGSTSGPATNAPGENRGTCANGGCHSSGSFDPELSILMLDEAGEAVEKYIPGNSYTVVVKVDATGLPAGYGFQMVSLRDSDNGPISNFSDFPENVKDLTLLGRQYVEHSRRLPVDSIPVTWTAPEVGTGSISFYAAANAVNGNGSPTGDGTDSGRFTFEEDQGSSTADLENSLVKLYPNPAYDVITIQSNLQIKSFEIFDLAGRKLSKSTNKLIDMQVFQPGTYVAKITTEDGGINSQMFYKY